MVTTIVIHNAPPLNNLYLVRSAYQHWVAYDWQDTITDVWYRGILRPVQHYRLKAFAIERGIVPDDFDWYATPHFIYREEMMVVNPARQIVSFHGVTPVLASAILGVKYKDICDGNVDNRSGF